MKKLINTSIKLLIIGSMFLGTIASVQAIKYDYPDICRIDAGTDCPDEKVCCPSGEVCRGRKLNSCIKETDYTKLFNFKADADYSNYVPLPGYFRDICEGTPYSKTNGLESGPDKRDECCEIPDPKFIENPSKEFICCPQNTLELYGNGRDECCAGTPYGADTNALDEPFLHSCCIGEVYFNEKLGKENCCEAPNKKSNYICADCEKCAGIYEDLDAALAEMELYANAQGARPSAEELKTFQGPIKTINDKYIAEGCSVFNGTFTCTDDPDEDEPTTTASSTQVGIECSTEQLIYGQCKLDVYDTLGIRKADGETSVGIFVQDIVLSATMFIGTIVTIAIVVAGLMFVLGGANPNLQTKAKTGLINAIIGLVIVMSSYFIIRLVQFIVKGE